MPRRTIGITFGFWKLAYVCPCIQTNARKGCPPRIVRSYVQICGTTSPLEGIGAVASTLIFGFSDQVSLKNASSLISKFDTPFMIGSSGAVTVYLMAPAEKLVSPWRLAPPRIIDW